MNWDAIGVLSGLLLFGFFVVGFVWCIEKDLEKFANAINGIKDHQHWQDDEWQRTMHRCADLERTVEALNNRCSENEEWRKEFKDEMIKQRDRVYNLAEKQRKLFSRKTETNDKQS